MTKHPELNTGVWCLCCQGYVKDYCFIIVCRRSKSTHDFVLLLNQIDSAAFLIVMEYFLHCEITVFTVILFQHQNAVVCPHQSGMLMFG